MTIEDLESDLAAIRFLNPAAGRCPLTIFAGGVEYEALSLVAVNGTYVLCANVQTEPSEEGRPAQRRDE